MSHTRSANAVRAGAFVLITLVVAVAVVVVLAGLVDKLEPRTRYVVRFDLIDGAAGLEMDSLVRLGGRDIGQVVDVDFEQAGGASITGVLVDIAIDDDLVVHEGATAFLERPLLGSGAVLNFESLGDTAAPIISENGMIPGVPQVPQFMVQAGYGSTQREQLQHILARATEYTDRLDIILADFEAVASSARSHSEAWFDDADNIFSDVQAAAREVRDRITEGRELIASIQDGVDANRENVDSIIVNVEAASADVREATEHFNATTLALIDEMLADGRDGVADVRLALERVDTLLVEQTPAVRKSIANARLASDQLRLTMGEVRRSPWRLLHRPSEKELEFELLYDAARTYADAVSDLRDAGEALDAASTTDAGTDIAPLAESVGEAFDRYRDAEDRFLDLLTSRAP